MPPTAQILFDEGRLAEAIRVQTEEVRSRPTEPQGRYVLFALLCFAGELERAARHLDALALGAGSAVEMRTLLCRSLVVAELERREVWAGKAAPLLAPDAPESLSKRIASLQRLASGDTDAASRLLDEASRDAVPLAGTLNDRPFDQIRDTDDPSATCVEVFAQGRCLWLSFEQIRSLDLEPPKGILDLLWAPARLCDRRGNEAAVHLPVAYAGSHAQQDDRLRLGRMTEWVEVGAAGVRGVGQKVWLIACGEDEQEIGLLDVRTLRVDGA